MKKILCIVTGGAGDGARARRLAGALDAELTFYDVDKSKPRRASSKAIWKLLNTEDWDLVYLEGTGIVGGGNLIRAAIQRKQRYIVSSGDPIGGFFRGVKGPLFGSIFEVYERLLYRHCTAFVGWTPYLAGMAMKMGARRAITVEGAVDLEVFRPFSQEERSEAKASFGLDPGHLICGVVGSLLWNPRHAYCYGLELVESLKHVTRDDVSVLIVGDGTGRAVLEERVPDRLRSRVVFTGRLPQPEVVRALNAMDVGFITQTLDKLGSYRLTTKLPEYLATGLPVAMSPIPGFYDYVHQAGWALPAHHPASPDFHRHCAHWLDELDRAEIYERASKARIIAAQRFDYEIITRRFAAFVLEVLDGVPASSKRQETVLESIENA